MNNPLIRDNYNQGSVGAYLTEVINSNSAVSIVSAYFTIYAYHKLKKNLDTINNLRFLFGDPTFTKIDTGRNVREFKIEDDNLVINIDEVLQQKSIARECAEWIQEKVEVRSMVKPNFLHGKLYHVIQENGVEKAVAGSSNFTVNGLGLGGSRNIELNMIIDSDRERQELKKWFDELWNDNTGLVADVKDEVIKYLNQLYVDNEPEFIYFKTLFHIFGAYLDDQAKGGLLNESSGFYDSEIWDMLYDFQKDGVKGAINKILKHNGCIIADSVGLGKTFEALAVIKYFELLNCRVLVICPKKLVGNWTIYQASQNHQLNPFIRDRFNYTVLQHTDLGRKVGKSEANGIDLANFNWSAYDLIVIDESHNFRNNAKIREMDDGEKKYNRAGWLMDKIVKAGAKTRVLQLSATPVNNTLRDLRNQIAFITEDEPDALRESSQIKDIATTLKTAQTEFTLWVEEKKKNENIGVKDLLQRLDSSFFRLLDELTIARSRKHIKSFYQTSKVGKFPTRLKPLSVSTDIDLQKEFPTYDDLHKEISGYKLSIFHPAAYLKDEAVAKYEAKNEKQVFGFNQSTRESFLINMMKINYLKRLESSIESFEISMDRTIKKITIVENKIIEYLANNSSSEIEIEAYEDEIIEEVQDDGEGEIGEKLIYKLEDLKLDEWLKDLENDRTVLTKVYEVSKKVTPVRDAKLEKMKEIIKGKITNAINQDNKKVLVFTAFTDTAEYIYKNLKEWAVAELQLNIALVCGSKNSTTFGKNDYDSILTNFSPKAKNRDKLTFASHDGEIDILIATDCISEGQNLQDCDCLINYDIHWNPVRIIQRFGRIDRLGSVNDKIQMVNFWPTDDLDTYLNLKERVESRMALVDLTATGEDNMLNNNQIEELITEDLKYRSKQLKKLREEVLDLEEMNESISLTDFTLDDFRVELLNFMKDNRERLTDSPLGLYAVVPAPGGDYQHLIGENNYSDAENDIIRPGVIYCLRHKDDNLDINSINPLHPYFLVYIRNDGTVRFNYTSAKFILDIFRRLCQGIKEPYAELCTLFNNETADGTKMERYSLLLHDAIREIVSLFRKRNNQKLTSDRGAKIVTASDNFELVTWLVIK